LILIVALLIIVGIGLWIAYAHVSAPVGAA